MHLITLNSGESRIELQIPEDHTEITLSQAVQFNNRYENLHNYKMKALVESDIDNDIEANDDIMSRPEMLELLVECAAGYFDIDPSKLMGLPVGIMHENIMQGVDMSAVESGTESLSRIINMIMHAMATYTYNLPSNKIYKFEHKGEIYCIPATNATALTNIDLPTDLTVSEAVECLEVKRMARVLHSSSHTQQVKDNARFTEIIRTVAILSRKEGEKFPREQVEINRFIKERTGLFQDIPMKIGYDIYFFLISTMLN